MISYTKQFMEKDDQGEYQLYVPFVVVVKDGKCCFRTHWYGGWS